MAIALANKYRPKGWDSVCDQESIKLILKEQIESETHKNAYLFTGGAGTGKTTCARIFANELNKGEGNPIEIDAASNNGVEDVRKIISEAKFKSIDSRYRIYIIDECHMLSTGAWNALLKLLEEPPKETIFIMCTTDPQKIPATILSRVQRYDFQRISFNSILDRLVFIIKEENRENIGEGTWTTNDVRENEELEAKTIHFEKDALEYIAKIADGGMRTAISLLDKCLSYSKKITIKNVTDALGTTSYTDHFLLTKSILNNTKEISIEIIEQIHRNGKDIKQFIKQYVSFLVDVQKYLLYNNFDYISIPSTYEESLNELQHEKNRLLEILRKFAIIDSEIKYNQDAKSYVILCLMLMEV